MKGFNEAVRRENASDLRDYFLGDGQVAGLRSIHGPLIDMAQSGFSSGRDPESQVTGRRFDHGGLASKHRKAHAALFAIAPIHRDILCAAYGHQRPWHPQVMRALKHALSEEYTDAFGAALLSKRIQEGMQRREELAEHIETLVGDEPVSKATKRRKEAKAKPGVLVWSPKKDGLDQIAGIAEWTAAALHDAHKAFAAALGQLGGVAKPKKQARKVAAVMPFDAPGGW